MKEFAGVFILKEQKRENTSTETWRGESDRLEILPDPRWHKRPPNKKPSDTEVVRG